MFDKILNFVITACLIAILLCLAVGAIVMTYAFSINMLTN
jgi:hypothetical protein